MKTFLKLIIFIMSTSILLGGVWYMTKDPHVDPTLTSLLELDAIRKNARDVLNETGVTSADDIKYKVEEKRVMFIYGKHKFAVAKEDLMSSEFIEKFNKLKLDVTVTKSDKIIVKYDGVRVKEIV